MEHVGYLHVRDTDAVRHDIYFDGRSYKYWDNKKNPITLTLPSTFTDKFMKEKDIMEVTLDPPSIYARPRTLLTYQ